MIVTQSISIKKATNQICKNKITKMQNEFGEWKEGYQLDFLLIDYCQSMFSSSSQEGPMEFLEPLRDNVIAPKNEVISRVFSKEEIVAALQ